MKKYLFYVGIDISKLKLDVVLIHGESSGSSEHFIVENTQKGVKEIVSHLLKKKIDVSQTLFCFENTGVYTYPLSYYFSQKGFDYWIVPAIEIKRSKGISRGKNDKTDAKDIAMYSVRNIDKLRLSSMTEMEIQQLKLLFTEREKVMKSIHLFESSKENIGFTSKEVYKMVNSINSKTINHLKKTLKELEAIPPF